MNPSIHSGLRHALFQALGLALMAALLYALPVSLAAQTGPQMDLPRIKLSYGMHQIDVQVAANDEQRQTGLMFRKAMPLHEGMLFVFEQATKQCFWMKNTLIPLSAAFIDDAGRIVNIVDMQPQTTNAHCSVKPVRFVLEMNLGWFDKRQIKAGDQINGQVFQAAR
jgi:uncharacterized protein